MDLLSPVPTPERLVRAPRSTLSFVVCFRVQENILQDEGWRDLTVITVPEFEGYCSGERAYEAYM